MHKPNFKVLEVGEWYLNREGYPVKVVSFTRKLPYPYGDNFGLSYKADGSVQDVISSLDLITLIETPVCQPKKSKVPCGHVLYKNEYSDYFITNKPYTQREFEKRLPKFEFIAISNQLPVVEVDDE